MVDICPPDGQVIEDYRTIRRELEQYSSTLAAKREIVVANKMDLTGSEANLRAMKDALDVEVIAISAVTGRGLEQLTQAIWRALQS
jgi:GTP-binding protein